MIHSSAFPQQLHVQQQQTQEEYHPSPQQKQQKGEQIKRVSKLTREEFKQEYFDKNEPVVITDALTEWPALSRWKDYSYLKSIAPDDLVPVTPSLSQSIMLH